MSRRRTTDKHQPHCVYHKHGAFWLVKRGKWEKLAATLSEALTEYAKRVQTHGSGSMPELIERIFTICAPSRSQTQNGRGLTLRRWQGIPTRL